MSTTTLIPPRRFVETLRKRGLKIRIRHLRYIAPHGYLCAVHRSVGQRFGQATMTKGGETQVDIRLPDGREFHGEAKCSAEDTYNRRVGVWLAVKRALARAKPLKDALEML